MKYFILLSFFLAGCVASKMPTYQPADNDEYIEQLEAQTDQEIKADTLRIYTYAGIGLFTAGVAMLAFTPKIKSALVIILGGGLAMGSPFIFNSDWFAWIFGTALAFALLDGLYILYRFSVQYISNKTGKIDTKQE
ncbi:hypothetical protein UFOVP157_54 [uncultured Caudovirales phage]|uniref:Uncharacterized protein n=1 Tax=uncultured Caudovirales phage TaxID=2100421 RepID=A0A6J7WGI1_9CAUD|nr:hypothetical protein UFOVP157_54 [uncultured Caudovirales phage]